MSSKNVLFLDDSEKRIDLAKRQYDGYDLHIARTAQETIDLLKRIDKWIIVSLDHDLGGEVFADSSREDCGFEIVRFIESLEEKPTIMQVIIHSWNLPAARRMAVALGRFYNTFAVPFATRDSLLKNKHWSV